LRGSLAPHEKFFKSPGIRPPQAIHMDQAPSTSSTVPLPEEDPPIPDVKLRELALAFTQMASLSFGGGLTAWARTILVERRKWLTEEQFLRSLAVV
jgi:hypothetical protein